MTNRVLIRIKSNSRCIVALFTSQAQGLASEASELCETSNMYVQCYTSEEKLTVAAQSVAKSMSQVLLVALSKMEAGSEHYQKIQV